MTKIKKLTEEQEAYLPVLRDEWLKVGLSTDRIEREISTAAVHRLYRAAGVEEPRVMHFDNPTQCIIAINSFRDSGDLDMTNLSDNLWGNLWDSLWRNFADNLGGNLREYIWKNIREYIWENISENIGSNIRTNLGADLKYEYTYFWGGMDAHWLAWTELAEKIGVPIDNVEPYRAYIEYAKTSGIGYFFPGLAFVSDRPEEIHKDEEGRLHCETGPAIKFRDEYPTHTWHGTNVPAEWIENPDAVDPVDVIRTENVAQRAAGSAILGWPRMASYLNHKVIDGDPETDIGALVELTLPGLPEPGRFLMAQCPRNGTICEGVPRTSDIDGEPIETAIAAQAWRDYLPAAEYIHPAIRT